jgi:TonB family protein
MGIFFILSLLWQMGDWRWKMGLGSSPGLNLSLPALAEVTRFNCPRSGLIWLVGDWGSADLSRSVELQFAAQVVRLGPNRRAAGGVAVSPWLNCFPPRAPAPAYPELARRRGQQGTVILAVKVAAAGRALRVEVKRSSGFILLDEAAARAVRNWEFEPARIHSRKVDSEIEIPVQFKIVDHSA